MKPKRPRVVIYVVLFNRVSYATVWHQIIIVIITSGQEASEMRSEYTVSEYYDSLYLICHCPLENPSYLQILIICLNKWEFRSRKVRKKCCLYKRLCHLQFVFDFPFRKFANHYIFPFPKFANQKHISVSQITDFHFVSFRFANYIKPLERASDKLRSEKRPTKISRHNHTTDLSHVLITWKNLPFRTMKTNDCSLSIVA